MTEHRPLNTSPLPVKLRVEDYLLLDGAGAFEDYGKTELIEGKVFFMNAQHRPHGRLQTKLASLLLNALPPPLEPIVEGSIPIPPANVPQPDIVVTSEPDGEGLIPLASVRLVIEIADATLAHDLGSKAAVYAGAAIPESWVVDIQGRTIIQMWSPGGAEFGSRQQTAIGSILRAQTIDLEIDTKGL